MKTALIDVDGVLAAFTPHSLAGIGGRVKPEEIVTWEIRDFLNADEKKAILDLWHDTDWWLTIPAIEGAREGVKHIREAGYEIIALTAPFHTCKGWEGARRAWLEKHFDISPDHVIIAPGRRKTHVHGDILIDDKLETVEAWSLRWASAVNAYEQAFLFNASYNQTKNDGATWKRLMSWGAMDRHVRIYDYERSTR